MQPPRFICKGDEHKVLKLKKALYVLKQTPRSWSKRIFSFLISLEFQKFSIEHGVYVQTMSENELVMLCLYVDGLLITSSSLNAIKLIKVKLKNEF